MFNAVTTTQFKDNLNNLFESKGISVKADWNYVGMAGHSAGADTVLEMIMNDTSVSKVTLTIL